MPRRYIDYLPQDGFTLHTQISTVGSLLPAAEAQLHLDAREPGPNAPAFDLHHLEVVEGGSAIKDR